MKLYAIYIGGKHENALIELHDMRFVIAKSIEDTYETLKKTWWGSPETLHLDCWGELTSADGHNVQLKTTPAHDENKLFFVNLGGYDSKDFTELHKNVFVVAPTESKAKVKALKQILDWESFHRDYQYEVENILNLGSIAASHGLYIHLEPSNTPKPFEFTCKYVPIGKN